MDDKQVVLFIESEQNSYEIYKLDKTTNVLNIQSVLPFPFFFPYSYGFIENTFSNNNELNGLLISNRNICKDKFYLVYIIGVLIMEDENGINEIIICVLEDDYLRINDITDLSSRIKDKIVSFFSNFNCKDTGGWNIVYGFKNKNYAIQLYQDCIMKI